MFNLTKILDSLDSAAKDTLEEEKEQPSATWIRSQRKGQRSESDIQDIQLNLGPVPDTPLTGAAKYGLAERKTERMQDHKENVVTKEESHQAVLQPHVSQRKQESRPSSAGKTTVAKYEGSAEERAAAVEVLSATSQAHATASTALAAANKGAVEPVEANKAGQAQHLASDQVTETTPKLVNASATATADPQSSSAVRAVAADTARISSSPQSGGDARKVAELEAEIEQLNGEALELEDQVASLQAEGKEAWTQYQRAQEAASARESELSEELRVLSKELAAEKQQALLASTRNTEDLGEAMSQLHAAQQEVGLVFSFIRPLFCAAGCLLIRFDHHPYYHHPHL